MEQYGNTTTYNVELVLHRNILSSEYWRKTASKLETVEALIDQIYYDVDHVEPWMAGRSSRGPSSAFCLLHRLGELAPTPRSVRAMLDHVDSPYIRAVALLYLRYVADPRKLWEWFERYLGDGEEVSPSPSVGGAAAKAVTIGEFARELLVDPFYYETIFPRIPKPVADDLEEKLRSKGLPTRARGNAGLGGPSRRGGNAAPSSVKSALMVSLAQRAPNQPRSTAAVGGGGGGSGGSRRRSRSRSPGARPRYRDNDDRERDYRHRRDHRRRDDDDRDRRRHDDDRRRHDDDRYYRRRSRSRSRSPHDFRREKEDDRYRGGGSRGDGYYDDRR